MIAIEPIRPRIVSVVGVIWLYLGACWFLFGVVMTFGAFELASTLPVLSPGTEWLDILPWFFASLAVAGALGGTGALQLLKLRDRGRRRVKSANWLAAAAIGVFTLRVAYALSSVQDCSSCSSRHLVNPALGLPSLFLGSVGCLLFIFMTRKLDAREVAFAILDTERRLENK